MRQGRCRAVRSGTSACVFARTLAAIQPFLVARTPAAILPSLLLLFENLLGGTLGIYLLNNAGQCAIGIKNIGLAKRSHIGFAV